MFCYGIYALDIFSIHVMKKQTREELIAENELMRKRISQFLGSWGTDYYSRQKEVIVLSWAEICFELGRKMSSIEQLELGQDKKCSGKSASVKPI